MKLNLLFTGVVAMVFASCSTTIERNATAFGGGWGMNSSKETYKPKPSEEKKETAEILERIDKRAEEQAKKLKDGIVEGAVKEEKEKQKRIAENNKVDENKIDKYDELASKLAKKNAESEKEAKLAQHEIDYLKTLLEENDKHRKQLERELEIANYQIETMAITLDDSKSRSGSATDSTSSLMTRTVEELNWDDRDMLLSITPTNKARKLKKNIVKRYIGPR